MLLQKEVQLTVGQSLLNHENNKRHSSELVYNSVQKHGLRKSLDLKYDRLTQVR